MIFPLGFINGNIMTFLYGSLLLFSHWVFKVLHKHKVRKSSIFLTRFSRKSYLYKDVQMQVRVLEHKYYDPPLRISSSQWTKAETTASRNVVSPCRNDPSNLTTLVDPGPLHLWSKCRGPIDPNCLFLIVRLRWAEMYSTVVNIVYGTITNLWSYSTR
jgi:hypothetical protein